ncbi:unnamed protein product [Callosobruchus maculatus]|uniref:Uncharacterized protein n=1 Tax=Callosobruchus maculatus TaxID=64391 RepID=A0A653DG87_CALMS|nr:unnamed protein product [Callosobruchus maculatus]
MSGNQVSNNELLEAIQVMGNNIMKELTSKIEKENQKIIEKFESCVDKIKKLEIECNHLQKQCADFDRYTRKNNVMLFGLTVPTDYDQLLPQILEQLNKSLELTLVEGDINNITKFKVNDKWALKLEFVSYLKKKNLLKNVSKLKGTTIYISEDLSYNDRQVRKQLYSHLKAARAKKMYAKIVGDRLQINNDFYTLEDLENEAQSANQSLNEPNQLHRHHSAPATPTPTVSQTFFEDSISNFAIKTPKKPEYASEEIENTDNSTEDKNVETPKLKGTETIKEKCEEKEKPIKKKLPEDTRSKEKMKITRCNSTSSDKGVNRVTRQTCK